MNCNQNTNSQNSNQYILYKKVYSIKTIRNCDKQFTKEDICFDRKNIISIRKRLAEYINNELTHKHYDETIILGVRVIPVDTYKIDEVIKYNVLILKTINI